MASLLFVSEPIELCVPLQPSEAVRLSFFPEQWGLGGGELSDKGQAWLMQEPGAAVACWYGGRPCLCDVWHGPLSPHTGQDNNPANTTPPCLSPLHTAPPPSSIHGRSFQQVTQRANKEASSFCLLWNVQCQKGGEMGGRGWDSKKAYNLLRLNWTSHFVEGTSLQTLYASVTKRREQHGSICHEGQSLCFEGWSVCFYAAHTPVCLWVFVWLQRQLLAVWWIRSGALEP